jgi:glycosyltransferase involved in cell wall biosynthesis
VRDESPRGLSVGFMASATIRKGFHLLPEIDERVSDVDLRWSLFTAPSGDELPETWRALRTLPSTRVEFSGKLVDVRPAYGRCDVVLCPSLKESFCRVAAEAMMNGIPVIASDIEPLRELLGDGEAGILFPAGDSAAAADAIRRLGADPALRQRLGERGRVRATAFEPETVVDRLVELYGVELAPTSG